MLSVGREGERRAEKIPVEQSGSSFGWEVLFTGQRWDEGSGLYLFRMRVYCAGVGVFVQRDVARYVDGANLYLLYGLLSEVDPLGWQRFQRERHHRFVQKNGMGQKTVDKFCLPNGAVPSVNIDHFTTPMLGPNTTKGTVHYVIEHVQEYGKQYNTLVGFTKPCDCYSCLKGVLGLMVANWVAANTSPATVHKPGKGVYGNTLRSPFQKLECFRDPAPRGRGVEMMGTLVQKIISVCQLTEEQTKRPTPLTYRLPDGRQFTNMPLELPRHPVVLNPDSQW